MILSDTEILLAIRRGDIVIDPFDIDNIGGNSYDVRLAPVLRVYDTSHTRGELRNQAYLLGDEYVLRQVASWPEGHVAFDDGKPWPRIASEEPARMLDCAVEPVTRDILIPKEGVILVPGVLYLASTVEYTETHAHVPYLDGRSSIGRLGISIHATAGRGDVGFCNHWTMEITVAQPVRVYADIKIGQLTYHRVEGQVLRRYTTKSGSTYGKLARDKLPQPSRLWTKMGR